ncbi:N-6 DNA methylase [bacterium]|nr:N-6 DNA methylase [bacterium]
MRFPFKIRRERDTMREDLETLIRNHAQAMASRMVEAAESSFSEEDIRHECNKMIDEFVERAELGIKGRHEYGLAGGFVDSKYGGVVIEYKSPKGAARITEAADAPAVAALARQIERRFRDLEAEEHVAMERIFGVGCDGKSFIFARWRGTRLEIDKPQPVTPHTVERLLRAVVSVGVHGFSFTPTSLAQHFGADSPAARDGIRRLHEVICGSDNPKVRTFFHQWQILFGEVCGYDIHGQSARIRKLAEHYDVRVARPAELLFGVHTYYALFIKLLAAEIVTAFSPLGVSTLKQLASAPTSERLAQVLGRLEQGGIWSELGIRNFLEGDLFSWYLDAWDERCATVVRDMARTFDRFDPTTLSIDPLESRDLLKHLYQQLFPRSVRHDLGEYYTPDWLAELVLDELGYDGNPDKRLLDPACGSGTFLVMALNRVRNWFAEHRHACGFREDGLVRKILNNVIGFDLNPLAVMAARTNYLLAIRDLLRYAGEVDLPVYLCDSIITPSEYGDLWETSEGRGRVARQLPTSAGVFLIPNEISQNREQIGRYVETLESCIGQGYSPEAFLERCRAQGINGTEDAIHKRLYEQLRQLAAENKNGIWARLIKNHFAPLFVGKVDFVAGNPPWINWESLPEEYRDRMKPLWQKYGLFTLSGAAARLGGGKKDLSMLFVYSAVDNYLEDGGRLGFVITQTVFKTHGAGDGFRRLRFPRNGGFHHLKPLSVLDLSAMQVFEGATNRTAVFACEKRNRSFKYPVPYSVWRGPSSLPQEVTLAEARARTSAIAMGAAPVDPENPSSPWLTAQRAALPGIRKVVGHSPYEAYAGCCTWLNGVFWLRVLRKEPNGNLVVGNLFDVGKIRVKEVMETVIEPDLVYPLLRGRDVKRWQATPSAHILLTQDAETRRPLPLDVMMLKYPRTYAYLRQFEGDKARPERGTLRARSGYRQYFKPTDPFYAIYNVGTYTMARWKVVWPEVGHSVRAAVVGSKRVRNVKPALPDHTLVAVSCESSEEAHFLCALLNSSPAQLFVRAYIALHPSPHIMTHVRMPKFRRDSRMHNQLAELSEQCHFLVARGITDTLAGMHAEIDRVAARIWGITPSELRAIQEALAEWSARDGDPQADGDGQDD